MSAEATEAALQLAPLVDPEPAPVSARLATPALVRFVIVGAAMTALGYVLFRVLLHAYGDGRGAVAFAQATAYAIGVVVSFFANRRWTFRSTGAVGREFPRFVTAHAGVLAASSTLLQTAVSILGLPVTLSWLLVTAVTTVANFVLQHYWVFRAPVR